MHSGHGDETPDDQYRQNPGTPEPHRGVVLPPEQPPQHYDDHVRPAGGQPWNQAPGAAQPLPPEAGAGADATMMFPPYPQATPPAPAMPPTPPVRQAPPAAPVPEADATQFLPPYPGSTPPPEPFTPDPFRPEPFPPEPYAPEAHTPGSYPPAQFPPEQFGAGTGPGGYPAESEAEATRHLSLSIFDEPSYDQPQGAPSYDQSYDEPQSAPSADYDHLYRQDGPRQQPRPEPARQPQYRVQSAPPAPAPAPGYADPYDGGSGGNGSRRRLSRAAVIGIVVGGCALAGLAAGAALSMGGGDDGKDSAATTKPPASTGASAQPGTGADDAVTKQAKALDALLKDSGSSRSSVVSAVESIKSCKNLPQAANDLRAAAGQRGSLVTRLAALQVDSLPQHGDLTEALNKAWAASAAADNAYASWADQAASDGKTCKSGKAKGTPQKSVGDRESGSATTQKKRAVRLWNAIAKQHGLTEREYSQL
ncbi:hypothetical protein [Streptomyces sp. H39-S7]|uniref:hypothetical protein n=1 Tax=Streptomyces sp. H39-S7 TaxID=3004357 RepID=UPI0022AEC4BF|nr:hypothetical protein [Streptomyces sp. H39-S7]MCZ4118587.1 hypothetical protein [Streptomyces sp. H39-S7]